MNAVSVAISERMAPVEQSFDSLVREHKNRIHSYICRLTNDGPDVEDLTQEVFVRAYQSMAAFRRDAAVDTWLYRIATNLVIDRYRRRKRGPRWLSLEGEEGEPAHELPSEDRFGNPQARVELDDLQLHVQRAIGSLPPRFRAVVLLHDMEGLPYERVAEAVGCPIGTVKSRLFHARSLLRRKLAYYMEMGK